MSSEAPDSLREAMLRYLDGSLPEAETRELNAQLQASPELRREFAELLRQDIQLTELGAKLAENVIPLQAAPAGAWWKHSRAAMALAASVALLAAAAFLFRHAWQPETAFHFTRVTGEVWVERGDVRRRAATSLALLAGDRLHTGRGAEAEVQFVREPTRLGVRAETSLRLPRPGGKVVDLEEGTVSAKVAPQPPGEPLIFNTLQGEATVLGTELLLSSDAVSTHLAVTQGRVRLRRLSDGAAVEVGANQLAVAAEDAPLITRPLPVNNEGTGLLGEYFPGRQFGRAQLRRVDPQVQFNWDKDRPARAIHSDHFQVRWTGFVQPKFSERYTFDLVADDGVRLWVDGQLLV
nr:PA14 domain-containing protein [Verrucomicrobiota bacterium]